MTIEPGTKEVVNKVPYSHIRECEEAYAGGLISKQFYHAVMGHWPDDANVIKKDG